jgi:YidC/Oxa1 family membrane protein insertase
MDRRTIWAILLMMVIAVAPALFIKRPPSNKPAAGAPSQASPAADSAGTPVLRPDSGAASDSLSRAASPSPAQAASDTVRVTSPLYAYGIATRGGKLVQARLLRYKSMAAGESGQPAEILPPESELLAPTLVVGRDTVPLHEWEFTPSTAALSLSDRPGSVRLSGKQGAIGVDLTYTFQPNDYRIDVAGRITGMGPNGGLLLLGMGPTLRNTEANVKENHRDLALVTMHDEAERTSLAQLEEGQLRTLSGPYEWVALKSKYFVTALIAADSTGGRISGATAEAPRGSGSDPTTARIQTSLPIPADGSFAYTVYAGPMEYDRLTRIGHNFDEVNPYGWPGFRTLIRVIAVPVRWLLVWMHENLHLAYGLVLIVFGILIRLLLWPLNQKAMRANMKLQEVQPLMKDIQERYRDDPQRMQQEMFKLYKEHSVNPLGGCWPMLLPMPVLFALFFVFQNALELRGTSFLWLPDLSRPDPLYIIPLLMGVSMYWLTKVGQKGMEPNPQMKMMLYMMPAMMTVMFLFFPSGLNLYYTVSNLASIPQQWMLAKEREKRAARQIVDIKTAPEATPRKKKKA